MKKGKMKVVKMKNGKMKVVDEEGEDEGGG